MRSQNKFQATESTGPPSRRRFLRNTALLGTAGAGLVATSGTAAASSLDVSVLDVDVDEGLVDVGVSNVNLNNVANRYVNVKNVRANNGRILSHNHHILLVRINNSDLERMSVLDVTVGVELDGVELTGRDAYDL